jgi:hypothetical protein
MFYMEGREEADEELRFWRYRRLCAAAEKELGVASWRRYSQSVSYHQPPRS